MERARKPLHVLSFLLGMALVGVLVLSAALGPSLLQSYRLSQREPVDPVEGKALLQSAVQQARKARARLAESPTFFSGSDTELGCGLAAKDMQAGDWHLLDVIDQQDGNVSIWVVGLDQDVKTLRADFAWEGGEPVVVEVSQEANHAR